MSRCETCPVGPGFCLGAIDRRACGTAWGDWRPLLKAGDDFGDLRRAEACVHRDCVGCGCKGCRCRGGRLDGQVVTIAACLACVASK